MFIWLGDVAYVDKPDLSFAPMDALYVKKRFDETKKAHGYSNIKIKIGVWDDHDYG